MGMSVIREEQLDPMIRYNVILVQEGCKVLGIVRGDHIALLEPQLAWPAEQKDRPKRLQVSMIRVGDPVPDGNGYRWVGTVARSHVFVKEM